MPRPQSFARIVFAFTVLFFATFFIWPILQILKGGFIDADGRLTFAYLSALLADPVYLGALRNSFLLACATTSIALLIAMPLAFISDRFLFPGKALLGSPLIPMILPPFVRAIGDQTNLRPIRRSERAPHRDRPASGRVDLRLVCREPVLGCLRQCALRLNPLIIYLNAVASLANVDPAMEEAAENLGCTGFRRFFILCSR